MRHPIIVIALLIAITALAGCGQKGPLVRPTNAPAAAHSAPTPAPTLPTPLPNDDGGG